MRAYRARRREVTVDIDTAWREVRRLELALARSQQEVEGLQLRLGVVSAENSELRAEGRALRERLARAKARLAVPGIAESRPFTLSRAERPRRERLQRKRSDPRG